jgi:fructokinase
VTAVESIDTTGAGDAFVGGFLYQVARLDMTQNNFNQLTGHRETLESVLRLVVLH